MIDRHGLQEVLNRAAHQAGLAYQFSPTSYTYWAMIECRRARDAAMADAPRDVRSWIEAYEDYQSESL